MNEMRTRFFDAENRLQKELLEHQNMKYKLLNNTHELMRQGDKIDDIK